MCAFVKNVCVEKKLVKCVAGCCAFGIVLLNVSFSSFFGYIFFMDFLFELLRKGTKVIFLHYVTFWPSNQVIFLTTFSKRPKNFNWILFVDVFALVRHQCTKPRFSWENQCYYNFFSFSLITDNFFQMSAVFSGNFFLIWLTFCIDAKSFVLFVRNDRMILNVQCSD